MSIDSHAALRLGRIVAGLALFSVAATAQTVPLPYQLVIQPIFLNNGSGYTAVLSNSTYTARLTTFQEAAQKVWAQAGIRLVWQAPTTFTDANFFVTDTPAEMQNLARNAGHGQSSTTTTMNMWFTGAAGSIYGLSEQSTVNQSGSTVSIRNGVTITESAFAANSVDVIAHEIGHNLALNHNTVVALLNTSTATTIENLMYGGDPGVTTLTNIYPNGLQRDQLTADQIGKVLQVLGTAFAPLSLVQANTVLNDTYSYSAIPEPAHISIAGAGAVGLFVLLKRRRRSSPPKA